MDRELLIKDLVVVKRSGQRVEFNSTKIAIAIKKAFDHASKTDCLKKVNKVYEDVVDYINNNYSDRKTINVEDIQDIIETKLKDNKCIEVYQAFSDYRIRRAVSRQAFGIKQQHKFAKAIERIVSENSEKNINNKPNDILLDFGKTISSEYTKTYVLDNKLVRAHDEGNIYIHNLDYFNLGKLSSTHLIFDECVKEEDFLDKLISLAINAKEEIDGEISISSLDCLLENTLKYMFKEQFKKILRNYLKVTDYIDYVNYKKIEDIIYKENMICFDLDIFGQFILNDRVRKIFVQAYQDAFTNVEGFFEKTIRTLILTLNNNYNENKKYSISLGTNNSYEGKFINKWYLKVLSELDYTNNLTTIFKVSKNYDIDLINEISRLIVDKKNIALSFVDSSYNADDEEVVEYFSNGKRIFENPVYEEKTSLGRMIVSSVSVNMGRLGLKHEGGSLDDFYQELDEVMDITRNCLVSIFETLGNKSRENYDVIFNGNILDDDKLESGQKIRKIIKKGCLNLELAGLVECVKCLECDVAKQKDLLYEIINHVSDRCNAYTKEEKLNFIVSETSKHRPLKKLIELDKAIYGIKKGITDSDIYRRIDSLFSFKKDIGNDFNYIGKYQKVLSGGNLVKIPLTKSVKEKDVLEIIKLALDNDIGFIKFDYEKLVL